MSLITWYKLKGLDGWTTKADGMASAPVGPSVATPLNAARLYIILWELDTLPPFFYYEIFERLNPFQIFCTKLIFIMWYNYISAPT